VAAGNVVDRVSLIPFAPRVTTIPLPAGVWAMSIAADPASGAVWVTNNTYAKTKPQWAGSSGP
jgi:hypothetical protein